MQTILPIISIFLLVICTGLLFLLFSKKDNNPIQDKLSDLQLGLKEDFRINREENSRIARENRSELNQTMQQISEQNTLALREINKALTDKMQDLIQKLEENHKTNREELKTGLKDFNLELRNKFDELKQEQLKLVENTEKKLEQMRETVDEKLQKTLNERLGQSFETVGKQLMAVQEGLGEMKSLAQDVGGLKKVLSNVKMRGGIGEVQLEMLLEQILAPDQYAANVKTKSNSNDLVEFAIKLPGRDDNNQQVWLPVDAKFPKDIYEQLQTAYDNADTIQIELAQKNLENTIKKMAKDIRDKYIDPPQTTDFGILFLPFEGIYAEVVRKASLLEDLQKNYKIIVTGPTTLAAILNSLQMGFRTLAIQQRSSEVWNVLGIVKTEFDKFGGLLQKAQDNIKTGLNQLDDVVGVRTRAIQKQLRNIQDTPGITNESIQNKIIEGEEE
ncbi:MAG: DNA recombination protein RmuC [Chitinophagaceae bacterium]